MQYIYILKSEREDWYYIGITSDLEVRLKVHNKGSVRSTKSRRPFQLVYYEEYKTKYEARVRELEIKNNWQIKKELIDNIKLKNYPVALSSNG